MSKYAITRVIYKVLKYVQRQTTLGRKHQFDAFNHHVLRETHNVYHTYQELCDNPPEADLYIVGSDQIWNVFYETGRDPAFYLDFVRKGAKASYAASFSYLDIDEENMRRIRNSLETFNAVSVREHQGLEILNKMGVNGEWVLDPVFLLSVNEWKSIMTVFHKKAPYLLVYDFEGNKELKAFAIGYAKRHRLKIYSINDTYARLYADKNFNSAGPKEFLSLIYHCDAFVSNSFHGTAFSILFRKPVFVFNRHRHKVNSRMESLTSLLGLSKCIVDNRIEVEKAMNMKFDFDAIAAKLETEKTKSKQFIKALLDDCIIK